MLIFKFIDYRIKIQIELASRGQSNLNWQANNILVKVFFT